MSFIQKKISPVKPKEIDEIFLSVFDLSVLANAGQELAPFFSTQSGKRGCQGFSGLIPSTFLDKYFLKNVGQM